MKFSCEFRLICFEIDFLSWTSIVLSVFESSFCMVTEGYGL